MNQLIQYTIIIAKGFTLTLSLLAGSLCLGLCLGVVFAICRSQHIMTGTINRLISVLRGTPVLLQLSLMYFALPHLIGIKLGIITAGIITLGLNSAAYLAEIFRAGIEHLPKGQMEAALTLEIPSFALWRDIILPQVVKNVFPAVINETIALLKETALISTIGGMDIMRQAESVAAEQFTYFMPLTIAGLFYYGSVLLIEQAGKIIEKKL